MTHQFNKLVSFSLINRFPGLENGFLFVVSAVPAASPNPLPEHFLPQPPPSRSPLQLTLYGSQLSQIFALCHLPQWRMPVDIL